MIFGGGRKLLSLRKQEEFLGRVIVLNVALNILERPISKSASITSKVSLFGERYMTDHVDAEEKLSLFVLRYIHGIHIRKSKN